MQQSRTFEITDAKREAAPLLAAICGMSGTGKTYSSLLLARGMVGPKGTIVLIDTEGGRGKWYANDPEIGEFKHIDFRPPYGPDHFVSAINAALAYGADVIVVDSISHEWEGEGGVLAMAEVEESRMQNNKRKSQAKWARPKIAHKRLMTAIRSCPKHIIMCVREKSIMDVDVKPAKEVFEPVCERSFIYDMTLALRLVGNGVCSYMKVPKFLQQCVTDKVQLTKDHGAMLVQEANAGIDLEEKELLRRTTISNLEQVARDRGMAELQEFWSKLLTKEQKHMVGKDELERIKIIAKDTDIVNAEEREKNSEQSI